MSAILLRHDSTFDSTTTEKDSTVTESSSNLVVILLQPNLTIKEKDSIVAVNRSNSSTQPLQRRTWPFQRIVPTRVVTTENVIYTFPNHCTYYRKQQTARCSDQQDTTRPLNEQQCDWYVFQITASETTRTFSSSQQ